MEQKIEKIVKKYRDLFKSKPEVKPAHEENKGHFYISPTTGEKYHSVTFFTSFIRDPALGLWRMNKALEFVKENLRRIDSFTEARLPGGVDLFEQAKQAPESEFLLAGSIGTAVHKWREEFFKAWIEMEVCQIPDAEIDAWPLPKDAAPEVISGCRAIKKFLKETGYIPVACELALVDDELKVGGTIDDLGVFPNKEKIYMTEGEFTGSYKIKYNPYLGFVDLKTSNQGKKPAYAYQVRGFYQRMIWKTFKVKPKKTYILHTSKENGSYDLIDLTNMSFLEKSIKNLVQMSRDYDTVTEAFKPKVRMI